MHRGAYFAQLRTTAVRKLLPESWGFMCPVHTPDGSPCGLLTHLTAACRVVTRPPRARTVGSVPEDILKVHPVRKAMVRRLSRPPPSTLHTATATLTHLSAFCWL